MFIMFSSMGSQPGPDGKKPPPSKTEKMIQKAKASAPMLFSFLDSDSNGELIRDELELLTHIQANLKNGGIKNMTREIFEFVDTDADQYMDASEIKIALAGQSLENLISIIRTYFPSLKENLAVDTSQFKAESVEALIRWLDRDDDGMVGRKEAGKGVASFKSFFLEASTSLSSMGPMLAMFGGSVD